MTSVNSHQAKLLSQWSYFKFSNINALLIYVPKYLLTVALKNYLKKVNKRNCYLALILYQNIVSK